MKIQYQSNYKIIQRLESSLHKRIFGQDHVIKAVVDMLSISMAGLGDSHKPIASFLFTGPTGVGKTELTKELAVCLNKHFVRFDMSEYSSEYSVQTLLGGQAGLVGYDRGGLLTNAIIKEPSSVLLLDELEKADPKVLNTFLQVLDYGILTDTQGKKADFTKTIIIMTSNLGANEQHGIGFGNKNLYKGTAVLDFLTPEFRNRLDKIIEFNALTKEMMVHITDKFLGDLSSQLSKRNIHLDVSKEAKQILNEIGFDPNMGARSILRAINSEFKKEISRILLSSNFSSGTIRIDLQDDDFTFNVIKTEANKKTLFDISEKNYDFATVEEAQEYARENLGTVITRSPSKVGYIIKSSNYSHNE